MKNLITAMGILGTILFFFSMVGVSQAIAPLLLEKNKVHSTQGPDVTKTPGVVNRVPIPYPDSGNKLKGTKRTMKKLIPRGRKKSTESSGMSMSTGDNAGVLKGVKSHKNKGKVQFKKSRSVVKMGAPGKAMVSPSAIKILGEEP